jgi:hypothetical protein
LVDMPVFHGMISIRYLYDVLHDDSDTQVTDILSRLNPRRRPAHLSLLVEFLVKNISSKGTTFTIKWRNRNSLLSVPKR